MMNTNKRNERMEQLKNAGVDTTKYFEIKVNEDIPKGSTLRIVVEDIESQNDDIKNYILNLSFDSFTYLICKSTEQITRCGYGLD